MLNSGKKILNETKNHNGQKIKDIRTNNDLQNIQITL